MQIDELETPALFIEQPVLNANIERMADRCRERQVNLRVDVGCHKIPMIAYKQLAAGACGIACRTMSEVQRFADAGFVDILVPRSALNDRELKALLNAAERFKIQFAADSSSAVNEIAGFTERKSLQCSIFIEIDDEGNRNLAMLPHDILELARRIIAVPSLKFAGITINLASPAVSRSINEIINRFKAVGISIPVLSCTGDDHLIQIDRFPQITELCVGVYALYDYSHVCRNECTPADCALAVLTTVIDTPSKNLAIVDAGMQNFTATPLKHTNQLPALSHPLVGYRAKKAFGATKNYPSATLCHLEEVFGHLSMADNQFKAGEKVCIIPANSETTISAHDTFAFVQGNRVLEILPIL